VRRSRKHGRRFRAFLIVVAAGLGGLIWWAWPVVGPTQRGGTGDADGSLLRATDPLAATKTPALRPLEPRDDDAPADPAAKRRLAEGRAALARGDLVKARLLLSEALACGLPRGQAVRVRAELDKLADKMIFTRECYPGDTLVGTVEVLPGETLAKIADKYFVTEELLAAINGLRNKNLIRAGQKLKIVRGPFRAVVDKPHHEMYIYVGELYICGCRVALGENGGTPTGNWVVQNRVPNPAWVNPRTGERVHADDPDNPVGEYWIGLAGVSGEAKGKDDYGIHGTNDESTIGRDVSMGCVRLGDRDIQRVYQLLVPKHSTVVIR
jgi:hypothetical protein